MLIRARPGHGRARRRINESSVGARALAVNYLACLISPAWVLRPGLEMSMRRTFCAAAILLVFALPAWAANGSSGPFALALATLVSEHSPTLSGFDKRTLKKLFAGHTNVSYPAGKTITVSADKINCKTSDVDITLHSCELTFGSRTFTNTGQMGRAHV